MPRLLIIDDEPAICWGLKRLGEELGHDVTTCATAEDGLQAAETAPPDVIVLDVRLPGMSGLEAIDRLRAVAAEAPILLITAHGDLATAVEACADTRAIFIGASGSYPTAVARPGRLSLRLVSTSCVSRPES